VAGIRAGTVDRAHLAARLDEERRHHRDRNPRSWEQFTRAEHLFTRVPMTWMANWAGGFPLALDRAEGARVTDIDGHDYVDFALGDTGAMAGHSPRPVVEAVRHRIETLGGITAMLPSEDGEWVAAELSRRFGMAQWSFALSATDANRWALRLARLATGRPQVLVFSYCYHGSVDETFVVTGPDGTTRSRPGNVAPAVDPAGTTVAVEFNDLDAVARVLRTGRIAAVLTEPALTNIGIVLPDDGFHAGLRALCDETGTLLMMDETHTFSAGPGGATRAWDLHPDIVTIGKAIAGGIPIGAFGLRGTLAASLLDRIGEEDADIVDVGGVGGTLAGNALSMAAARATLEHVLTDDAFVAMSQRAQRLADQVGQAIADHDLPWTVSRLGARSEYRFCAPAPTNGTESARAEDAALNDYLHLYLSNRGVLITPFHNMLLTCPDTTVDHVDRHGELFRSALDRLTG
jgi:glutamate-1-semialdehyde 2,1-aminomutase